MNACAHAAGGCFKQGPCPLPCQASAALGRPTGCCQGSALSHANGEGGGLWGDLTAGVPSTRRQGKTQQYSTTEQLNTCFCSCESFFISKSTYSCSPCACLWSAAVCKAETCFLLPKFPFRYCTSRSHRQVTLQLCPTNTVQMFITEHLMDEFKWEKQELRRVESY